MGNISTVNALPDNNTDRTFDPRYWPIQHVILI